MPGPASVGVGDAHSSTQLLTGIALFPPAGKLEIYVALAATRRGDQTGHPLGRVALEVPPLASGPAGDDPS